MGLIFDLDQTIIDSSIAETQRQERNWHAVYSLIGQFKVYPGVIETMSELHKEGYRICIVSSSPEVYCNKVLQFWNIPYDNKVCFHDTTYKKPHPEPILKALALLNTQANKSLSFGDRDIDIIASNSAKVTSVACLWGAGDIQALINSKPTFTISNATELQTLVRNYNF